LANAASRRERRLSSVSRSVPFAIIAVTAKLLFTPLAGLDRTSPAPFATLLALPAVTALTAKVMLPFASTAPPPLAV
jgi:hypothetical protein